MEKVKDIYEKILMYTKIDNVYWIYIKYVFKKLMHLKRVHVLYKTKKIKPKSNQQRATKVNVKTALKGPARSRSSIARQPTFLL